MGWYHTKWTFLTFLGMVRIFWWRILWDKNIIQLVDFTNFFLESIKILRGYALVMINIALNAFRHISRNLSDAGWVQISSVMGLFMDVVWYDFIITKA